MTIKQVSQKYEISADTLRYYERVGLIPAVHRRENRIRDYTPEDCRWVEFIKCMRNAGLPIETLIEYVSLFSEGDATVEARKALLEEQRDLLARRILEMQQTLERLNRKIDTYTQTLPGCEKGLKK